MHEYMHTMKEQYSLLCMSIVAIVLVRFFVHFVRRRRFFRAFAGKRVAHWVNIEPQAKRLWKRDRLRDLSVRQNVLLFYTFVPFSIYGI